ncbi:ATP-binding protein [Aliamphritea hakodatensis]|uniref:ATP-binding protein n=1 Tax=Aliamphritea hakodatensis TaxID=2895352 RepID=UPI0022FD8DB9|nr:ATP-binding protein [Aliamphritea hakodatensis]
MSLLQNGFAKGIRLKVFTITLVPLLVMTLMLAGYFISTRIADNETALIERGATMSRLMAAAAEFGIISELTPQLKALSKGPIQESDVKDVIFLNASGQLIYRSTEIDFRFIPRPTPTYNRHNGYWLFATPVMATGILIDDSREYSEPQTPEILGWVVIAISSESMRERQLDIIINTLILLLIGILVTFVVAARVGHTLTDPIIDLTELVGKLQQGQLSARATEQSDAEIGSLERGINLLAERVQASNQLLESQVDKATQRLRKTMQYLETQNHALHKARERADQANMAKDEFLARMSHELRTPLTSVLGFTGLLKQTDLSYEQQEHCRIISQTSTMLLAIIDDILDFAKLQSNAIHLESIPFSPEECIHSAIEMQAQSAATKGLELVYQVSNEIPPVVLGDPMRLRQVATNLIGNAIKFTEHGHVIVSLKRLESEDDSVRIELTVQDSGIGIDPEQQAHLFSAFSQADSSITRRFGGSGLGLVIVRKLLELMAGEIRLNSMPGQGTEFICALNCLPAASALTGTAAHSLTHTKELIIYDRHRSSLQALTQLAENSVARVYPCRTLEHLNNYIEQAPGINSALIFGLSADPDTAREQKRHIPALFRGFKGNILLLVPSLNNDVSELTRGQNHHNITVLTKPLRRVNLSKWLSHSATKSGQPQLIRKLPTLTPGTRVLIAEDNDFNRLLLSRIMSTAGAVVSEAINGLQAIQLAEQHQPDIILMDVHMPRIDGIEATRQIRGLMPNVPVIALTANVVSSEEQALSDAGVNRIEYKPINDTRLLNTMRLLLKQEQGSLPPAARPHDESSATDLSNYKLSAEDLHAELLRQLAALQQGFSAQDIGKLRNHAHQLTGLAGLFELPALELASLDLSQAIKAANIKDSWHCLWRLQRLIEHHQYQDNTEDD